MWASERNMLHLVTLLLASSGVTMCAHFHREYYLINISMIWVNAQSYCREYYTDLASIGSHEDMQRLVTLAERSGVQSEMWIGLKETGPLSWLWSEGETQTSHGLVEYTNWANLHFAHDCGGMRHDGTWNDEPCETAFPFVCQERNGPTGLHVVLQERSWRQAQEYCRQNYTDLASVRNQSENLALQQKMNETGLSYVWSGLFRDGWKWSDQSDSSYRHWRADQPNDDGFCALFNIGQNSWFDRNCGFRYHFVCYKAIEIKRTTTVRVEMKSDTLDFSDSAVSQAILNQIQQLYGSTLQWRVRPDGKIFHKKEMKHVSDGC